MKGDRVIGGIVYRIIRDGLVYRIHNLGKDGCGGHFLYTASGRQRHWKKYEGAKKALDRIEAAYNERGCHFAGIEAL